MEISGKDILRFVVLNIISFWANYYSMNLHSPLTEIFSKNAAPKLCPSRTTEPVRNILLLPFRISKL
jgi:hypothetical protein